MAACSRIIVFVSVVLAAAASAARAQGPATPPAPIVMSVDFSVDGRPELSPAITALSDVRVGQPLRQQDWRATIAHLDSLGRYEDIQVLTAAVPGGVAVTFRLVPRRTITRLELRGDTGVPSDVLHSLLRQRYGGVPTGVRLPAVASAAEQLLNDEGYLDAQAIATTEQSAASDGATMVVEVQAGTQARVGEVDVRGTSSITAPEVIERTGARAGAPFRRRVVESALEVMEDELRARGYYEAQVTLLQPTRALVGVNLVVAINAGPRVEVTVTPADALPGSLESLIPVQRLGSADQDLLEDAQARIERALRAQGYWKAAAPFTRRVEENGERLTIAFAITRGPRYYVERVELPAALSLPPATLRSLIGIESGDLFDQDRFVAGLALAVDAYRRAGYHQVAAEPSYEETSPGDETSRARVVLHPNITEGPRGVLTRIAFTFEGMPQVAESDLRATLRSAAGQPYVELDAARDEAALRSLYLNRGFRTAQVLVRPEFAADGRDVTLAVQVNEGRQIRIGQISIVGNERVSEESIREELRLVAGAPAGVAAINDAQARLIEMGVFRRVALTSTDQFADTDTHLIVNVVEAPATTFAYGGGLEGGTYSRSTAAGDVEDRIEFAPRGSLEISRRNLGGRNRTVSLFSRVSFKRNREVPQPGVDTGGFGFTEYRVTGTFRERRAFRSNAELLLGLTSEQAVRTSFNFIRRSINAELLQSVGRGFSVSGRYTLDFTRLFDQRFAENDEDQALIDRAFPQVRLSILSTGVGWDRRDNLLNPTNGSFVTADAQVAARSIGSEVGFLKTFMQASAFRPLGTGARTVFASRAELGLARGFARTATVIGEDGVPVEETVEDLPANHRFFAGGNTTVRGFALDRLAVPELLNANGLPLGGNAVVVFNAELRRTVSTLFDRNFGVVGFFDGGNVFKRAGDLDLSRLRGALGAGVRYDSPLGPLRLDFGIKLKTQTNSGRRERGWEYHLSIGEAF